MQDLKAKLEKLLTEAEDCELIGRLATDVHKRALFLKLAVDLRAMARDIEAMIATRPLTMPEKTAGTSRVSSASRRSRRPSGWRRGAGLRL